MTESEAQINICEYLSLIQHQYKFIFFSVPNEAAQKGMNSKNPTGAQFGMLKKLKRMGMTPGVADIVLVHKSRAYFIEVKTDKGRLSDNQKDFRESAEAVGSDYAVVRSVEDMEDLLFHWCIT